MRLFDSQWRYLYLMMYNISAYLFVLFSVFSQYVFFYVTDFIYFYPTAKEKKGYVFQVYEMLQSLWHTLESKRPVLFLCEWCH